MSIFTTIEKANYLATAEDVATLATSNLEAQQMIGRVHGCYFRILLARTQHAICGKPTLRAREKAEKMTPEDTEAHLKAFETQHAELYAAVLNAVRSADTESRKNLETDEQNRRALERNRRTNFARSAASVLRTYIKRGGNVLRLAVPHATKSAVAAMTPPAEDAEPAEGRSERTVTRAAARIVAAVQSMAAEDKEGAVDVLRKALGLIAGTMQSLGIRSTTKPAVALAQDRLLRTEAGVFWPAQPMQ